jgi:hypothetical protein
MKRGFTLMDTLTDKAAERGVLKMSGLPVEDRYTPKNLRV